MQSRGPSVLVDGAASAQVAAAARRISIPLLFDLTRLVDSAGRVMGADWLADIVRRAAEPGCDVRILVEGAHQCFDVLQELADALRCDVYFVGPDVDIVDVAGDAVAVDRTTGDWVEWLVLRPSDVPVEAPAWFDRRDGHVRARSGLATLPLAGGVAFATRRTFYEMAKFVSATGPSPSGVTVIAAVIQDGQFGIGWYTGSEGVLGGDDFARLIAANLDTMSSTVQIALTWPDGRDECRSVDAQLQQLADALDRTVWVPDLGTGATADPGCPGPAAVDAEGLPASWVAYAPQSVVAMPFTYTTDNLGRLVQARPVHDGTEPSITDVDLETAWRRLELEHGHALRSADVAFQVLRFDRPSEAAALCRVSDAWASYLAEYERVLHAESRGSGELSFILDLVRQLDQTIAEVALLSGEPTAAFAGASPRATAPLRSPSDPAMPPASSERPALRTAPRVNPQHHISWLPQSPLANADPVELYLWTSLPPEYLPTHGVSTTDGFVLARLDASRLAARVRSGFVLRLMAPAGTAVTVSEYTDDIPAWVQHRAREAADTILLPTSWLSRVKISACYEVDAAGKLHPAQLGHSDLVVAFRGAEHGVGGLPSSAVRWPGRRKAASAFLSLPEDPEWIRARLAAFPGWLPLHRRRPNRAAGYRIFEVEIGHRSAIDVAATLEAYADTPLAKSSVAPFAGVELALPSRVFRRTTIVRAHELGGGDSRTPWNGRPFTDALPAGVWSDTSSYPVVTSTAQTPQA